MAPQALSQEHSRGRCLRDGRAGLGWLRVACRSGSTGPIRRPRRLPIVTLRVGSALALLGAPAYAERLPATIYTTADGLPNNKRLPRPSRFPRDGLPSAMINDVIETREGAAHWHANTVMLDERSVDVVPLNAAEMHTTDMIAQSPGTWMFHCHVEGTSRLACTGTTPWSP